MVWEHILQVLETYGEVGLVSPLPCDTVEPHIWFLGVAHTLILLYVQRVLLLNVQRAEVHIWFLLGAHTLFLLQVHIFVGVDTWILLFHNGLWVPGVFQESFGTILRKDYSLQMQFLERTVFQHSLAHHGGHMHLN